MKTQKSYAGDNHFGDLYLVPTPIGNLEDITFRAIETLKKVDVIAAEDTRNTQKILNHFDISTKQVSFHDHNSQEKIPQLIDQLQNGLNIAQVSDAGMPSISDPGADLVHACIDLGIKVIPLPGPNAALTALIASGISPQSFYFHGFLPRKKQEIEETVKELKKIPSTLIFYEAPHRLKKTILALSEVYQDQTKVVLAREISKKFEEFIRGTFQEIISWVESNQIRGEYVIIIEKELPFKEDEEVDELLSLSLEKHVQSLMEKNNISSKVAIKEVAKYRNIPKREVYAAYHDL